MAYTNGITSSDEAPTRSIYGRGPTFSLENFSSRDFIVKDFIESLTEAAQPTSRVSRGPNTALFDAKPLIRTFELAQKRLNELSDELSSREAEQSQRVKSAEEQHASRSQVLGRRLLDTTRKLDRIDAESRAKGFTADVAIDTGRKLEELDRQRRRAVDASFLIQCWDEVSNTGELTLLENLRRSGTGEGKIRSARIAKQLLRISERLDNGGHGVNGVKENDGLVNGGAGGRHINTKEIIEKFVETLENDMLKLFDDFYRRQNFEEMKNCATVLQDFRGGASVQEAFVNQHQFFIDRSNLVSDDVGGDADTWVRLSDPDADLPGVEPGLQSLIDEVRMVVQEESQIIRRAFPQPEAVLGKFVQRIFQQSIQQRLETVLAKAEEESTLAYLRSLQAARNSISVLVEDLKAHGLTEHPEAATSQTSQLLDHQLEDLFSPYFGGSAYIEKEKQSLSELYRSLLFKFDLFHNRRQKEPKTYLASLRSRAAEALSSAREATDAYVKSLDLEKMSSTQKRILLSVAGIKNEADTPTSATKPHELELSESDGRLSPDYAKRMLKWLAESVRRGLELSNNTESPRDISALHTLLLQYMARNYIELSLESLADSALSAETIKKDPGPDFTYLTQLKSAITIISLLDSCTQSLLIPLASTSLTIRREMEKQARTALVRIEESVNTIEQRTVDAVTNWTSRLLSLQSRNDFRPKETEADTALAQTNTQTCIQVLRFLTQFYEAASATFSGKENQNLLSLLNEIAIELRGLLLEHFKKYQVNRLGAIMLVRDMSAYVDSLRRWDLGAQFDGTLEVLVEVGNLFVLRPEAVKERIRGTGTGGVIEGTQDADGNANTGGNTSGSGGALTSVSRDHLRPYLMKRDDYMDVGMQNLLYGL